MLVNSGVPGATRSQLLEWGYAVCEPLSAHREVAFNMSRVQFLDSFALSALAGGASMRPDLQIVNPSTFAARVLGITGLADLVSEASYALTRGIAAVGERSR